MRKTTLLAGRIVALCLAFVLGFFSAFGAIAGGIYFAYSSVSLEKLNEWSEKLFGQGIPLDEFVDQEADTPATSLTIQDLLSEIQQIKADKLTLEKMIEKYGLIIPQDVIDKMPTPVLNEIPFSLLFSEEGVELMMQKVTVADIIAMIPEDIASSLNSDPAREAFSDNTLAEVVEKDIGYIFDGVQLGYITGVTYVLDENGVYQPVMEDPDNPTLVEIVAPLDLGGILSAVASGEGDVLEVIENSIGDVAINSIFGTFMSDIAMLSNLLGEATLADVIVANPDTNKYEIDIMKAMDGRKVGSLLGYTEVETTDPETLEVSYGWIDDNGSDVKGISAKLSEIYIVDFMNGTASIDTLMDDLIIADVLGYEKSEKLPAFMHDNLENQIILETDIKIWYSDGAPADKMMNAFADKTVTELGNSISDLLLAEILGYCMYNGEWYLWEVQSVNGSDAIVLSPGTPIMSEIADTPIGDMSNIEDEIREIEIGILLGYESICDEDGEHLFWSTGVDENGEHIEPSGITATIADLTIKELSDGDTLQTTIDDTTIADVMGYTKNSEDGKWYKDGAEVTGPMAALAESKVGELSNDMNTMSIGKLIGHTPIYTTDSEGNEIFSHWEDDEGNPVEGVMGAFVDLSIEDMKDNEKVTNAIQDVQVSDALGLKYIDGVWYNSDGVTKTTGIMSAIADVKIKDLSDEMQNVTVGEMLGLYEKDGVLYDSDDKEASSVVVALADTSVGNLNSGLNTLKVGEILGYTYNTDEECWYEKDGTKASGVTGAIADTQLINLDAKLSVLQVGEVAGYVKLEANDPRATEGEGWYQLDDATGNYVIATGVLAAIADLTVDQIGNNDTVTDKIGTVKLAEALGYTSVNGVWYDKNNEPLEGIMAALADKPLDQMNSAVDDLKIKDVFPGERTGLLSIINEDSYLNDMETTIDESISNTPVQFFIENGLIVFDETTMEQLDDASVKKGDMTEMSEEMQNSGYYDEWIESNGTADIPTWRTQKLSDSFNYIVKLITPSVDDNK